MVTLSVRAQLWRTHSCVPCSHSCEHLFARAKHECVRHILCVHLLRTDNGLCGGRRENSQVLANHSRFGVTLLLREQRNRRLTQGSADPEYAAHYLTAAYRESRGAFLVALKDVANAMFGMTKLAESVEANRVSLYRALSEQGNPTLSTFNSIIEALNLEVSFSPRISIAPAGAPKKRQLASTNKRLPNSKKCQKTRRAKAARDLMRRPCLEVSGSKHRMAIRRRRPLARSRPHTPATD
jgi:probable addiction module antidote protein